MIWLGLAVCAMAGMFAVAATGSIRPAARPIETAPTTTTAGVAVARARAPASAALAGQVAEISAIELWMAYSRDPVGADRSFRDHAVLVTGTVRSIERDFQGRLLVRLSTGDAFETINATMAGRDNSVASAAKGRAVSLLCQGRGMLMGAPLLGGCSLS
jgi:tRNA_anti-like